MVKLWRLKCLKKMCANSRRALRVEGCVNLSEGELQTGGVVCQRQRQTSSFVVTVTTGPDHGGVQVEIPGLLRAYSTVV